MTFSGNLLSLIRLNSRKKAALKISTKKKTISLKKKDSYYNSKADNSIL